MQANFFSPGVITMAGEIRALIDRIIKERAKGNPVIAITTETKIILKGVNSKQWHEGSNDDPKTLALLKEIAREFGVDA